MAGVGLPAGDLHVPPVHIQKQIVPMKLVATMRELNSHYLHDMRNCTLLAQAQAAQAGEHIFCCCICTLHIVSYAERQSSSHVCE